MGEFTLKGQKQGHNFDTEDSPVNIVAQEKKLVLRKLPVMFKNVEQIMELAVNISYNSNGRGQVKDIGLVVLIDRKVHRICSQVSMSRLSRALLVWP